MDIMKRLRDQTWEDLKYFVTEREKKPWRNWDRNGFYYKPDIEDRKKLLKHLQEEIDSNLIQIGIIEPKFNNLISIDIPPFNNINAEMIQFITDTFGNEGWLQLFSLKRLRQQQKADEVAKQKRDQDRANELRGVKNNDMIKLATGYEQVVANESGGKLVTP